MITKEKFQQFIKLYGEIEKEAEDALIFYHNNIEEVDSIELLGFEGCDENYIEFSGVEPWQYGEDVNMAIDARYLYDEKFREDQIKRAKREREEEENKLAIQAQKEKEEIERMEKRMLADLKVKYESN